MTKQNLQHDSRFYARQINLCQLRCIHTKHPFEFLNKALMQSIHLLLHGLIMPIMTFYTALVRFNNPLDTWRVDVPV